MRFFVENLSIHGEGLPGAAAQTSAGTIPAMLRRRLSPLGRTALAALSDLKPRAQEQVVCASSWGDLSRSLALLESLSETGEMSPADFALSVHNAIGANAAIWLKNHAPSPAVCAGALSASAGLFECALALSGSPSVLLLRYEPAMPALWQGADVVECAGAPAAWARRRFWPLKFRRCSPTTRPGQGRRRASSARRQPFCRASARTSSSGSTAPAASLSGGGSGAVCS